MTLYDRFDSDLEKITYDNLISAGWIKDDVYQHPTYVIRKALLQPDIVLTYNLTVLAVIEVKSNSKSLSALEQASYFASELDVPFALGITPDKISLLIRATKKVLDFDIVPTLSWFQSTLKAQWGSHDPRIASPYQSIDREVAPQLIKGITDVIGTLLKGQKYTSFSMPTGAGRMHFVMQILWKLIRSSNRSRILFLAERIDALETAYQVFAALSPVKTDPLDRLSSDAPLHLGKISNVDDLIRSNEENKPYDLVILDNVANQQTLSHILDIVGTTQVLNALSSVGPVSSKGPISAKSIFTLNPGPTPQQVVPIVPEGYQESQLGEIANLKAGAYFRIQEVIEDRTSNLLVLEPKTIQTNGEIDFSSALRVQALPGVTDNKEAQALSGDILVAPYPQAGNIIKVALVPKDVPGTLICKNPLYRIRVNRTKAGAQEVYNFLRSDAGQLILTSLVTGSVIERINFTDLTRMKVFLPPLHKERSAQETETQPLSGIATVIRTIEQEILPQLKNLLGSACDLPADPDLNPDDYGIDVVAHNLTSLAQTLVRPPLPNRVMNQYPTPIAMAYRRFDDAIFNTFERVSRLIDLYEAACYFIYNVFLADFARSLHSQGYTVSDKSVRHAYKSFSMAFRIDFVDGLILAAEERANEASNFTKLFVSEIVQTSFTEKARELKDFRNLVSHTATPTESQQKNLLDLYGPKVKSMLNDLDFLTTYKLVRIPILYVDEGKLYRRVEVYRGVLPTIEQEIVEGSLESPGWIDQIDQQHLLLVNPDGSILNLHPMYQLMANAATRFETQMCFFKHRKGGKLVGETVQGAFEVDLEGSNAFDLLSSRL